MIFYIICGFCVFSFLFYTLGRHDGEKGNTSGLIVWVFANVIALTWSLITELAMR